MEWVMFLYYIRMNQHSGNMRMIIFSAMLLLLSGESFCQVIPREYFVLINRADSLYNALQYKSSASAYSEAFAINNSRVKTGTRYDAACSWALAGNADSAFAQLLCAGVRSEYTDYAHIATDPDLNSLHSDSRWEPLLGIIKRNWEQATATLNKQLVILLDSIFEDDQHYRQQLEGVTAKFGGNSREVKELWSIIRIKDSGNLIRVEAILNEYGWPGKAIVGIRGTQTLFLVIQHAPLIVQEKYLPGMRDAVSRGKAYGSELALLEDRVALGEGRKQLFGSQIKGDPTTNKYYVCPLEDPDHVDIRRAEMGLDPLEFYVAKWQIKWDVEEYKKELREPGK